MCLCVAELDEILIEDNVDNIYNEETDSSKYV